MYVAVQFPHAARFQDFIAAIITWLPGWISTLSAAPPRNFSRCLFPWSLKTHIRYRNT